MSKIGSKGRVARVGSVIVAVFSLVFLSFANSAVAFAGAQSGVEAGESSVSKARSGSGKASFTFVQPSDVIVSGGWDTQDFDIGYKHLEKGKTYSIKMPDNIILEDFIVAKGSIIESVAYKTVGWETDYSVLEVKTRSDYTGSLVEGSFGASFENDCRIPGDYTFDWNSLNNGLVVNSDWSIYFELGDECVGYEDYLEKEGGWDSIDLGVVFKDGEYNGHIGGLEDSVYNSVVAGVAQGGTATIVDKLPDGYTFDDVSVTARHLGYDGETHYIDNVNETITVDENELTIVVKDLPVYSRVTVGYYVKIDGVDGFNKVLETLAPDTFFCDSVSSERVENVVSVEEINKSATEYFYTYYGSYNSYDEEGEPCIPWDNAVSIENITQDFKTDPDANVEFSGEYELNVSYDWIGEEWGETIGELEYDENFIVSSSANFYDYVGGEWFSGELTVLDGAGFVEVPYSEEGWDNFGDDSYVGKYMVSEDEGWYDSGAVRFNVGKSLVDNHSFKLGYDVSFSDTNDDCYYNSTDFDIDAGFGFVGAGGSTNQLGNDFESEREGYYSNKTCVTVDPNYVSLPISESGLVDIEVDTNIKREESSVIVKVDKNVLELTDNIDYYLSYSEFNSDVYGSDFGTAKKISDTELEISFSVEEGTDEYLTASIYLYDVKVIGLDYKGSADSEVEAVSKSGGTVRSVGFAPFVVSTLANELSVDKWVSPAGKTDWVKELDLGINPASTKVDYLLDFSSNSDFKNLSYNVIDELPDKFSFEGFVVNDEVVKKDITVAGLKVVHKDGRVIVESGSIDDVKDLKVVFRGSVSGEEPIINTVLESTAIVTLGEKGSLIWKKVDETGKTLSGAEFLLEGPNGYRETISNNTGVYSVGGLEFGEYSLTETKAPTGYILDSEVKSVELTEEVKSINIGDIVNKKEETPPVEREKPPFEREKPKPDYDATGDSNFWLFIPIGLGVIAGGSYLWLRGFKRV